MKKNSDWKSSYNFKEKQIKYYKRNKSKITNYNYKKNQLNDNYQFDRQKNENEKSTIYIDIDNCKSFYPKNYYEIYNKCTNEPIADKSYKIPFNGKNEFSDYDNLLFNKNFNENENEGKTQEFKNDSFNEKKSKNEIENELLEEKKEIKKPIKKSKKFGIKSIPHPKKKKNSEEGSYIIDKHLFANFKKERKLSISSNQNNFDSAKNSISTLNTSSSSRQEKLDVNEENNTVNNNIETTIILNNICDDKKTLKNKFDNENETNQNQPINPYLENTQVLELNVKIAENKTVTVKIKRFDDLFLTIKLFCEINSINEKFIKPLIIQSLSALNTIYQLYNCKISSEEICLLQKIEDIYNYEK
jgi:hypothetical protein